MAKNKVKKEVNIPEGMKCYQKTGGGNLRVANRILKQNQKFWCYLETIPEAFRDVVKEVAPDTGAIVLKVEDVPRVQLIEEANIVPDKFEMVKALDEDGEVIKKGNSNLYNVVGEDGKPANEKPLRKGKAEEFLEVLNA